MVVAAAAGVVVAAAGGEAAVAVGVVVDAAAAAAAGGDSLALVERGPAAVGGGSRGRAGARAHPAPPHAALVDHVLGLLRDARRAHQVGAGNAGVPRAVRVAVLDGGRQPHDGLNLRVSGLLRSALGQQVDVPLLSALALQVSVPLLSALVRQVDVPLLSAPLVREVLHVALRVARAHGAAAFPDASPAAAAALASAVDAMALDAHHASRVGSLVGALGAHRCAATQAARDGAAPALLVDNRAAVVVPRESARRYGSPRKPRVSRTPTRTRRPRASGAEVVMDVSRPANARRVARLAGLAVGSRADTVATGLQCVRAP